MAPALRVGINALQRLGHLRYDLSSDRSLANSTAQISPYLGLQFGHAAITLL